jgi:hypothetical protein
MRRTRKVKTVVQPQHDHDWQLVIASGISYYTGTRGGQPGFGWATSPWSAKKFGNMGDVRREMKQWNARDVGVREFQIKRVWTCIGEVRATIRIGEALIYPKKNEV